MQLLTPYLLSVSYYQLSFAYAARPDEPSWENEIDVYWNGTLLDESQHSHFFQALTNETVIEVLLLEFSLFLPPYLFQCVPFECPSDGR